VVQTRSALFTTVIVCCALVFMCPIPGNATQIDWTASYGGSDEETGSSASVDPEGNPLATGWTSSTDFPCPGSAYDTSHNGSRDAVLIKFSSDNTGAWWATYFGGGNIDQGLGVAADSEGNVFITGRTQSSDFPTTEGAYDESWNGGSADAFVAKFDTDGGLLWSTYLGGSEGDHGFGVAADSNGNVYVVGETGSSDFPTTEGAYDRMWNGGVVDVFVAKFSASGELDWSTFLGGTQGEVGPAIAVSTDGDVCVTGYTRSSNFPVTPGAYDTTLGGNEDVFVTTFTSDGGLVWSTFLGGSSNDRGNGISVDEFGNIYVCGESDSTDFPGSGTSGFWDAFVSKFGADGNLQWSTCIGGSQPDHGFGVAAERNGNVWVAGLTGSNDFPVVPSSPTPAPALGFASKLSPTGALLWSNYLPHECQGLAADSLGGVYATGGPTNLEVSKVAWEVVPEDQIVSTAEYIHFTQGLGESPVWSLLHNQSGGIIDADTGLYQAGVIGDVVDAVLASVTGDSATTTVTVTSAERDADIVGPPTSMDLDGGGVGITDVIGLLRIVVGLDIPTSEEFAASDFDCDGNVTISDVINCLRVVVGLPPVL